ncbi:MAG TPA: RHS repeat-associated core domain-containing protein [Anaerolineales bacterium]|nr:RHS repeat-associated core domain-containing protein [Anaerolineales bacterium]
MIGRFTSADTIVPQGQGVQAWDRYAYVNNNPLNYTDPSGHVRLRDGDTNDRFSRTLFESYVPEPWPQDLASQVERFRGFSNRDVTNVQSDIPSSSPSTLDEISQILNFGVEGLDLLDLVEDGIQYGRPVYRQVKYAFPLGGYEYTADGLLQLIDDRTSNLTPDQRIVRGVIRAGESFVTDAASVLVGGASAGALQAGVPIPLVPAGVGYVVGSYTTSVIIDNTFVNKVNPYIFREFLGGP